MIRLLSILALSAMMSGAASAHPGHIADVAGHSHWLGWAAVAGAGLLAAWLGKKNRRKQRNDESEADVQGEPAAEKA